MTVEEKLLGLGGNKGKKKNKKLLKVKKKEIKNH